MQLIANVIKKALQPIKYVDKVAKDAVAKTANGAATLAKEAIQEAHQLKKQEATNEKMLQKWEDKQEIADNQKGTSRLKLDQTKPLAETPGARSKAPIPAVPPKGGTGEWFIMEGKQPPKGFTAMATNEQGIPIYSKTPGAIAGDH